MPSRHRLVCCALVSVSFLAFACSSSDGGEGEGDGGGTGDGSGIGGATGSGSGLDGLGATSPVGSTVSGALSEDDACAGLVLAPEPMVTEVPTTVTITEEVEVLTPVAIYVVLDNSGSMDDSPDGRGSESKWDQAVEALGGFLTDPASEGIDVAIQYFHPVGADRNPDECDGSSHAAPAVPMGPLPNNSGALLESLADTGPDGDTPTVGALLGGTDYCADFQAQHPDERCVVVLVTDGQPNACGLSSDCPGGGNDCVDSQSESVLTPIVADGLERGVTTFTIGMAGVTEEGFQLLDALAIAGGSDCNPDVSGAEACDVSTTGAEGFLAALNAIRNSIVVTETITETSTETVMENMTLPCEWGVPNPPPGELFDRNLVNVTISNAGDTVQVANVPSAADCAAAGGGWYYDDPSDPTELLVCPQVCDVITELPDANVSVLFGCATEVVLPE